METWHGGEPYDPPGDIVYYESAKCLHGRNRPLTGPGAYYVNLFTHYRPVQKGNWWLEENPEGTPEPVIGNKVVSDECHVKSTQQKQNESVTVECDNPALGQYISRDLFQATQPDDLITWWRQTGPKQEEGQPQYSPSNDGEL